MKKILMSLFCVLVLALFAGVVSAAPTPATVPNQQSHFMNSLQWSVNLDAPFNWSFSGGDATLFTMSMSAGTNGNQNIITFKPVANAYGTATVTLTATDVTGSTSQNIVVSLLRPATLQVSALTLGSTTQMRSNPLADTTSKETQTVSSTVSITNVGNETASALAVDQVLVAAGYNAADLNITVTLDKTSLAAGESATATITALVPKYLDSVNSALKAMAFAVGSIKFRATGTVAGVVYATSTLNMQAKNMLDLDNVDVKVGDASVVSGKDDKTIKNIKPGDTVTLDIKTVSRFKDSDNVDINDAVVKVSSDDLDVDEEDDIGTLAPGDSETSTISFTIDKDQDDGTYTVDVSVEGADENGASHGEIWTLNFDVNRESHEIQIKTMTLTPKSADCGSTVELAVKLRNIGKHDEDAVAMQIAART